MESEISTKDPVAVEKVAQKIHQSLYPDGDPQFIPTAFTWAIDCFNGKFPGYRAIDVAYHDLEHTLQGTLCYVRIMRGRHLAGAKPELTRRHFELGIVAILLHDTGYLKRDDDTTGTGAKYTYVHVTRSADFAERLLHDCGFEDDEILSVQHMIRCTGVNVDLGSIPFRSAAERLAGFALGTADLLGQMAAADYVEKLPILYQEFDECQRFDPEMARTKLVFTSAEDLLRKTPAFWAKYVQARIRTDFESVFTYLNDPYPDGPNPYINWIEANIERLKQLLPA